MARAHAARRDYLDRDRVRLGPQALLLLAVGGLIGGLSAAPTIRLLGPHEAVITLSFTHAGKHRQECRALMAAARAARQPNMQRPWDCPRERWPLLVELDLDHTLVYRGVRQPAGLWKDGASSLYRRFRVPAGTQQLSARLRDSGRPAGFDYAATRTVELRPGQNLVIEFDTQGGFEFR